MRPKFLLASALISSTVLFSCGGEGGEGGATGFHYQGQSCAQCHSSGENAFSIGGTVFSKKNAQNGDVNNASVNHYVRLILNNGSVITSNIGRGTGNFWSNANIPNGVKFKVEVLDGNGNVVNKSAGYTHDNTRLNCNSCHTSSGASGAPGRIVSYDFYNSMNQNPAGGSNTGGNNTQTGGNNTSGNNTAGGTQPTTQTVSFVNNVYPILQQKCQNCHKSGGYASTQGSKLIFNSSSEAYTAITQGQPATQGYTSFINKNSPSTSLLLKKATNSISHGGGQVFKTTSQEYQTILNWIQQGAQNN